MMSDPPVLVDARGPERPSSRSSTGSEHSEKWSISEKSEVEEGSLGGHATDDDKKPLLQQSKGVKLEDEELSPEGSSNPTSDVRYVLAGQPTGWSAMAGAVRSYDEEKVKDTKEDVDTLLVFAGLFSAVLTAFIVESYQQLSPNTSTQMLAVMQQISVQLASFSIVNNEMFNSTAQPPANITDALSQPFQPSPSDISVNVLWFASLILSLITASFGMLVKQWLREYLAVENPSPQARLRIRRFRYPELMRWNVFEIAAILPVMQQIALALFFVGLCYFTESVHESVGHTTLPLVAGWAFCISTVTVLPMFFPRCPYKTALLKHLLQSLHIQILRAAQRAIIPLNAWYQDAAAESVRDRALRWTTTFLIWHSQHSDKSDERNAIVAERADLDILVDVDALQSNDELLGSTILESLHQIQPEWNNVVHFVQRVLEHRLQRQGAVLGAPQPLDLQTLSRQGWTAVIDILSYYARDEISQYVQSDQAIARWRRSNWTMSAFYIFFSPARYPMPRSGTNVLGEVLQEKGVELMSTLAHDCPRADDLANDRFYLLVQGLLNVLEDMDVDLVRSLRFFEAIMDARFADYRQAEADPTYEETTFAVQGNLASWPWRQVMSQNGRTYAARFLIWTMHRALRQMRHAAPTASTVPSRAITARPRPKSTAVSGPRAPPSRLVDGLVGMWRLSCEARIELFSHTQELRFRTVIEECFAMKESTLALFKALVQLEAQLLVHVHTKWVAFPCGPWVLLEDAQRKLDNFIDAVSDLEETAQSAHDPLTTVDVLRICYVALRMIEHPEALQYSNQWRSLLAILTRLGNQSTASPDSTTPPRPRSIRASSDYTPSLNYTVRPAEFTGVAFEDAMLLVKPCLERVQQEDLRVFDTLQPGLYSPGMDMDALHVAYGNWERNFRPEESVFDDEFVRMLGRIYSPPGMDMEQAGDDMRFFRLKKLGVVGHDAARMHEVRTEDRPPDPIEGLPELARVDAEDRERYEHDSNEDVRDDNRDHGDDDDDEKFPEDGSSPV